MSRHAFFASCLVCCLVVAADADETFLVTWTLDPALATRTAEGHIRVPVPTQQPYQETTYRVTGVKSQRAIDVEGNLILDIVPDVKPFQLVVTVKFKPHSFRQRAVGKKGRAPGEDVTAWLKKTDKFNPDSPALNAVVKGLKANDPASTIQNFRTWLKTNIRYQFDPATWRYNSIDDLLERRYAECNGCSALLAAMCRTVQIPARQVWGVHELPAGFLPPGMSAQQNQLLSHNWCEVYVQGIGWIPVEPQETDVPFGDVPPRRLRIAHIGLGDDGYPESLLAIGSMVQMTPYAGASFVPAAAAKASSIPQRLKPSSQKQKR